jgi:hypothetical protein
LSHRPETNAKKEGKEFVKFVEGLANVASNRPRRPKWAWAELVEQMPQVLGSRTTISAPWVTQLLGRLAALAVGKS